MKEGATLFGCMLRLMGRSYATLMICYVVKKGSRTKEEKLRHPDEMLLYGGNVTPSWSILVHDAAS